MKKNRKILLILGISILAIALFTTTYVLLTTPDKDTTLTALEKRWVEQNKNKIINVAVPNNIPVFGTEGEGVFFDYLKDFEKDIKLEFNKVSYDVGDTPSLYDYKFEITDNVSDNQFLFYQDYYVALSKSNERINDISELNDLKIATIDRKNKDVSYFLAETGANFSFLENTKDLFESLNNDEVDMIITPYIMCLDMILENEYNIVYNFKDISDKYVITLNNSYTTVNNILKKYFDLWSDSKYQESYNEKLTELYFNSKEISTKKQADFKGKIYNYGYVENEPFEQIINGEVVGINGEYLKRFIDLSNIEIKYKKYDSVSELKEAFNNNDIDFMFNNFDINSNNMTTTSIFDEKYVVLSHVTNNLVMDNIKSLKGETVYVLKDSLISKYLSNNTNANVKTYLNNKELFNILNDDMIIAIDYDVYNYYKNTQLSKYVVAYQSRMNLNYNFILKNTKENKVFNDLFSYYVSSLNYESIKNVGYQKLVINPKNETLLQTIINYVLFIVLPVIILISLLTILFKKKKATTAIKKEEKLRYIDMLTSLKNRNYLNANIAKWDEGKIYPQTVVIVDLNNVKYINDNFGHEEGDNLIKAAANILIRTQLENSDIIRTDGNEFLIYLIGYNEDEIINYMRKLYKEMKELPHGFGAAFGYSIIKDETKIVDDAINEATLDMRTNKEA